jgi:hypothetical protein
MDSWLGFLGQAVSPENRLFLFFDWTTSDPGWDAGPKNDTSAFKIGNGLDA